MPARNSGRFGGRMSIRFPPETMDGRRSGPDAARRVAFVAGGAAMAGVEFNAVRLAARLDRARWEVVLVCPEEGDLTVAFRGLGLRVCVLPRGRMFSSSIRLTTH